MKNLIRKANHPQDEEKQVDLIIDGLLSEMREHIITVKPSTVENLEEHCKLREKALKSVPKFLT